MATPIRSGGRGPSHLEVLPARQGYDLAAPRFERWHWFDFWRTNEAPVVRQWLLSLRAGFGLDAGSGSGTYLADIVGAGHRLAAVDVSWEMLAVLRSKGAGRKPWAVQSDIRCLPFVDGQFDWILCTRVLGHVPDLNNALSEFARVQRRGAEMLIVDLHPDHPYSHTAIRTPGAKEISVQTYKHSFDALRQALESAPLRLLSLREYRTRQLLWIPKHRAFEKLGRRGDTAVFYTCRLQRL